MAPCWPQAVKGSGAYYSSGLKMWEQKHSSTAWIVGIYRPQRLISEHLRDLTKQFRLCIFSAAWRCRQVGKDTHTHTPTHLKTSIEQHRPTRHRPLGLQIHVRDSSARRSDIQAAVCASPTPTQHRWACSAQSAAEWEPVHSERVHHCGVDDQ